MPPKGSSFCCSCVSALWDWICSYFLALTLRVTMMSFVLNSFFSCSWQKSVKSETQEKDDNRLPSHWTQCAFDTQPVSMIGILFVWRKKSIYLVLIRKEVFFSLKCVNAAKFQRFLHLPVRGAGANIFCMRPCQDLQCLVQNVFIV